MNIENASLPHGNPSQLTAEFIKAAAALTDNIVAALAKHDAEGAAAFWACLTRGGSVELRLETTLNGQRLMLQVSPPGGDPVRVLDAALSARGPGPMQ